jgi:hypothetical protein
MAGISLELRKKTPEQQKNDQVKDKRVFMF